MKLSKKSKNTLFVVLCLLSFLGAVLISFPAFVALEMHSSCYDSYSLLDMAMCQDWLYYLVISALGVFLSYYFYKKRKIRLFIYTINFCVAMFFWGLVFFYLQAIQWLCYCINKNIKSNNFSNSMLTSKIIGIN